MANIFLDGKNNLIGGVSFVPAALTTTTNGTPVDLMSMVGNQGSAMMVVGAVSGTQGTLDVKLQECTSTNGTFTDITGATFTQVTTSGLTTTALQLCNFKPVKRYVRAYATFAGTFTNMLFGVNIFGQGRTMPANEGGWDNTAAGS